MDKTEVENKKAEVERCRNLIKEGTKLKLRGVIIGAIIGLIFGIMGVCSGDMPFLMLLFMPYEFAGISLGWGIANNIINKMFGNLVIVGTMWFWIISFLIKVVISACIGLFALPVFVIKTVKEYKSGMKQADEIIQNLDNNINK